MRQVSDFGAIVGLDRFRERFAMLADRIAQHRQQSLEFLFTEQGAVGVQQRPIHCLVNRLRRGYW